MHACLLFLSQVTTAVMKHAESFIPRIWSMLNNELRQHYLYCNTQSKLDIIFSDEIISNFNAIKWWLGNNHSWALRICGHFVTIYFYLQSRITPSPDWSIDHSCLHETLALYDLGEMANLYTYIKLAAGCPLLIQNIKLAVGCRLPIQLPVADSVADSKLTIYGAQVASCRFNCRLPIQLTIRNTQYKFNEPATSDSKQTI